MLKSYLQLIHLKKTLKKLYLQFLSLKKKTLSFDYKKIHLIKQKSFKLRIFHFN